MLALAVLRHPRLTLAHAAAAPRPVRGFVVVVATGAVCGALEVVATLLVQGLRGGLVISALLPALFVGYWLLDAWLVDAGAGLSGRSGRRGAYRAVSALPFVSLVAYALLSLLEALAARWFGDTVAVAVGWLTLPVLGWFVALMVVAVMTVYELPALNAFALALLPFGAITTALLVLLLVLSTLHGAGVV